MKTQTEDLAYYLSLPYSIVLTPGTADDGGGWYARILELPGCMADGETQAEALAEIETVKQLWLESCLEHGDPIPEPQLSPSAST